MLYKNSSTKRDYIIDYGKQHLKKRKNFYEIINDSYYNTLCHFENFNFKLNIFILENRLTFVFDDLFTRKFLSFDIPYFQRDKNGNNIKTFLIKENDNSFFIKDEFNLICKGLQSIQTDLFSDSYTAKQIKDFRPTLNIELSKPSTLCKFELEYANCDAKKLVKLITDLVYLNERKLLKDQKININNLSLNNPQDFFLNCMYLDDSIELVKFTPNFDDLIPNDNLADFDVAVKFLKLDNESFADKCKKLVLKQNDIFEVDSNEFLPSSKTTGDTKKCNLRFYKMRKYLNAKGFGLSLISSMILCAFVILSLNQ